MEYNKAAVKGWVKALLFVAFLYSFIGGLIALFRPQVFFACGKLFNPDYAFLWQIIGAIEITLGIGYLIALFNPYKHWPIILIAFLAKLFTAIIFVIHAQHHTHMWSMSSYIIMDNFVWLVPFGIILYQTYRRTYVSDEFMIELFAGDEYSLDMFDASNGENLQEMSDKGPVLLVFLRHFGCTFCRESLSDISQKRKEIEAKGVKIVLVHMLENEGLASYELSKYGLQDVATISDPECILYKKFQLRKGRLNQLLGFRVVWRGIINTLFRGHRQTGAMGDIAQMPGVFLIHHGKIKEQYIHRSAADRPDYLKLASCPHCRD